MASNWRAPCPAESYRWNGTPIRLHTTMKTPVLQLPTIYSPIVYSPPNSTTLVTPKSTTTTQCLCFKYGGILVYISRKLEKKNIILVAKYPLNEEKCDLLRLGRNGSKFRKNVGA